MHIPNDDNLFSIVRWCAGSQVPGAKQERDEAILNERQSVQEIVRNSYLMHMIAFLHQLLCFYDVSFDWAQYIFKFAKSLGETVKPNVRAKDSLDIRSVSRCFSGFQSLLTQLSNGHRSTTESEIVISTFWAQLYHSFFFLSKIFSKSTRHQKSRLSISTSCNISPRGICGNVNKELNITVYTTVNFG